MESFAILIVKRHLGHSQEVWHIGPRPVGYLYPGVAARSWMGCHSLFKMTLNAVLEAAESHHKPCSGSIQKTHDNFYEITRIYLFSINCHAVKLRNCNRNMICLILGSEHASHR